MLDDPGTLATLHGPAESDVLELINAAKEYAEELKTNASSGIPAFPSLGSTTTDARKALLKSIAKMQLVLDEPSQFLRRLALHTQLLACLQWLCDSQVLACIPLDSPALIKNVASISDVPESQLHRITQLMATAGFLERPDPEHISHSRLSARFVTEPALLDAAMFMSEIVAPAALQMPHTTRLAAASNAATPFPDPVFAGASGPKQQQRLQRQLNAYMCYGISNPDPTLEDVLSQINFPTTGSICVVDADMHERQIRTPPSCAQSSGKFDHRSSSSQSVSQALVLDSVSPEGSNGQPYGAAPYGALYTADHHTLSPGLQGSRSVQYRVSGSPPLIKDADMYVLRLPCPGPSCPWTSIAKVATSELFVHLNILRNYPRSRMILTALVLPSPVGLKRLEHDDEEALFLRDISLMQLANEGLGERDEVLRLLKGIRDSTGMLMSTNEVQLPVSRITVFEIRYQPYNSLNSHSLDFLTNTSTLGSR